MKTILLLLLFVFSWQVFYGQEKPMSDADKRRVLQEQLRILQKQLEQIVNNAKEENARQIGIIKKDNAQIAILSRQKKEAIEEKDRIKAESDEKDLIIISANNTIELLQKQLEDIQEIVKTTKEQVIILRNAFQNKAMSYDSLQSRLTKLEKEANKRIFLASFKMAKIWRPNRNFQRYVELNLESEGGINEQWLDKKEDGVWTGTLYLHFNNIDIGVYLDDNSKKIIKKETNYYAQVLATDNIGGAFPCSKRDPLEVRGDTARYNYTTIQVDIPEYWAKVEKKDEKKREITYHLILYKEEEKFYEHLFKLRKL